MPLELIDTTSLVLKFINSLRMILARQCPEEVHVRLLTMRWPDNFVSFW